MSIYKGKPLIFLAIAYNYLMSDISEYQKRAWANKIKHNFNLDDVNLEFNYLYGEVGEAFDAWYKRKTTSVRNLQISQSISLASPKCSVLT